MKQVGDDFFGTGMMVAVLKHDGTMACSKNVLKMSVKTFFTWVVGGACPLCAGIRQAQGLVVGTGRGVCVLLNVCVVVIDGSLIKRECCHLAMFW